MIAMKYSLPGGNVDGRRQPCKIFIVNIIMRQIIINHIIYLLFNGDRNVIEIT